MAAKNKTEKTRTIGVDLIGEGATAFQLIDDKFEGWLPEGAIGAGLLNLGARTLAKGGKRGVKLFLESLLPGITAEK